MRTLTIILAAIAVSGPALAQSTPTTPPPATFDANAIRQNLAVARNAFRQPYSTVAFQENLNRRDEEYNPVRKNRADLVASLINSDQCAEAYQVTVDSRDREMGRRVLEVCGPITTPSAS